LIGIGRRAGNDYYSPEVDSTVIALPAVETARGAACSPIRDPTAQFIVLDEQLFEHSML
jgi:hypothetical protein